MLVDTIRLRDFRNIAEALVRPHPRFNILCGENGQGKTNFVEAIYLLSAVKSFRPQNNADLLRFGRDEAVLEARVDRGGSVRVVRLEISARGKRVLLNEEPVRNLQDFFGTVNVVVFGPDDMSILRGSPSERRRFVDRAIFSARPGFALESSSYEGVLKQRNALLKQRTVDPVLLETYDEQLIQFGADVTRRRLEFLAHFRPVLAQTFKSIFHEDLDADVAYGAQWADEPLRDVPELGRIEAALAASLARSRAEERERGFTTVGPHRDDLVATLGGRDVKVFASQGQNRAFVLAMKIAEIRYLEERFHFAPILLLDDVSSELDERRNQQLFEFLRSRTEGQVFITSTHRKHILLEEDVATFSVEHGVIQAI